ncbi:MAG: flagellar hook-length control protein FliK [Deltaproteobacteria bacterium]|nr:flagellar hook-length control protein FliK [Deltaproteobacteria bacterium]
MKTDTAAGVKASFGEEFSEMLASLMQQVLPPGAFLRMDEPVADKAAVENGAFTGFADAKGITAGALIETARLDGKVEIPVRSEFKVTASEKTVMDTRGETAPEGEPLIQTDEKVASLPVISEEPGFFKTESFNYPAPALLSSHFEEGVKPQGRPEKTKTPLVPEASAGLEKTQTPVHPAKVLAPIEKTGGEEIDESCAQLTSDSSDADAAASGLLNLLPDPNDRTIEARGGASESVRAGDIDVAEMTVSFSNNFEGERNEQETTGESDKQLIVTEPRQMNADGAVHVQSFGKNLEAASIDPPMSALKSAPVVLEVRDSVEAAIKLSAEADGGEVRMKLNPEALGEVRIRLDVSSGAVKAEIIVESQEVKAMIEADSSFLKDALSSHGLTLDKCVVEVARNADLKLRDESVWQDPSGDERASGNRGQENGTGNWHGRFKQERERKEDSGVDFFI